MTINDLKELCEAAIKDGLGESEVIVCIHDDIYESLTKGFSSPIYNSNGIQEYMEDNDFDPDSTVVLN
jgi:hypothetical protein